MNSAVPGVLEAYDWMLEEFPAQQVRHVDIPAEIFKYAHPGVDIGRDDLDIWFNRKDIKPSHVLLYLRLVCFISDSISYFTLTT